MSRAAVLVVSAVLVTLVLVAGGVLALGGDDEQQPREQAAEPFSTTPLSGYDTTGVVVSRGPFCDRVDDRQVRAALDAVPDVQSWQNGDRLDLGAGAADVVHEFGCRYAVQDVGVAEAWVFAPPVGAEQAQKLADRAAKAPGCQPGTGPGFGSPTLALTCTAKDGTVRASYRGLFGDAWLVCEMDRPAGATWDVTDRAGRWCVGVLQAAATG